MQCSFQRTGHGIGPEFGSVLFRSIVDVVLLLCQFADEGSPVSRHRESAPIVPDGRWLWDTINMKFLAPLALVAPSLRLSI